MSKEKPNGYWNNYGVCYEEAKKYSTITEFAKGSSGAHYRAKENGWIKDYTWFVDGRQLSAQKRTKWDYDACYELAKQCVKKSEMKEKNNRAYQVALNNGWFSEYTWFLNEETIRHQKRPSRVKWPYEKCKELALQYSTLAEFHKAYPSVYTVSKRNGWIDDYVWLKRVAHKPNYWTYERCYKEAQQYETRTQFQKGSGSAYDKALKENWLGDYTWFLNINTQWTYDLAYKEAHKYTELSDFIKNCGGAYNASRRNNWIERFTWLKKKNISQKQIGQFTLDGKLVRMFNGAREASRITGISYSGISQCCNGKLRKHGGYIWKYISGVPKG